MELDLPETLCEYRELFMNEKSYRNAVILLRKMKLINNYLSDGYILADEYGDIWDGEFKLLLGDELLEIGFVNKQRGLRTIFLFIGDTIDPKNGLIACFKDAIKSLGNFKLLTQANINIL